MTGPVGAYFPVVEVVVGIYDTVGTVAVVTTVLAVAVVGVVV